jgi:ornithine decarboxylase
MYSTEAVALNRIFRQQSSSGNDQSFFVCDLGVVERQYSRWISELPSVHPFYAVKCNPDDVVLKTLSGLASGFDVASTTEMQQALHAGATADNVILANPIKSVKDLQCAARLGVEKMTFDNADELFKIKEHHPNAKLVLRLLPDDSGSIMRFGSKFGAPLEHVEALLCLALRLGLSVIGTSFHIGSGCFDVASYAKAIGLCRHVFDIAEGKLGMAPFTLLDLGGGFPGGIGRPSSSGMQARTDTVNTLPAFEEFAMVIRDSLHRHFHPLRNPRLRIIAEPGRYMVTACSTLFAFVQGKREDHGNFRYYLNDGTYGSLNCILFDHAHPIPIPAHRFIVESKRAVSQPTASIHACARGLHSSAGCDVKHMATFFGPTCDSMDVIVKDMLIEELFVGDWVAFPSMGAYTLATSSNFNGMPKPSVCYVKSIL